MTTIPKQPVTQVVHVAYLPPGAALNSAGVRALAVSWTEGHAEDPLRRLLAALLDTPAAPSVIPASAASISPVPFSLLAHTGMTEVEERRLRASTDVAVVTSFGPTTHPFPALWLNQTMALAVAEQTGATVLEIASLRILNLDRWERRVSPSGAIAVHHWPIIPTSVGHDGLALLTTRGLEQLGLPELRFQGVPPNLARVSSQLVNGVAQALVELAARLERTAALELPDGGVVVGQGHLRRSQTAAWPPADAGEGTVTAPLSPATGAPGEPLWLDIHPPDRQPVGEWLMRTLDRLLPPREQAIRHARSDSEALVHAHRRAVAELPAVEERFRRGLPVGAVCFVKHGFATSKGTREFMWIAVESWQAGTIRGSLAGTPRDVPGLRPGQEVSLRQDDVYDWLIQHDDGGAEGNYTSQVLLGDD